uniref:ribbon-helix-helix domain-containing protein n=1 Tax=Candidatus Limivicinus sp. TaxID=3030905 RepID=UPI003FF14E12
MDYKKFRADTGIAAKDMIKAVKEIAPGYSKVHQSFVENPDKSGLCLLPSLDRMLVDRFGGTAPPAKKKADNRTLKNKLTVRLPDDVYGKFAQIRAREGCTTQELLRDLIENWLIATQDI